jgi:hypothetical protein
VRGPSDEARICAELVDLFAREHTSGISQLIERQQLIDGQPGGLFGRARTSSVSRECARPFGSRRFVACGQLRDCSAGHELRPVDVIVLRTRLLESNLGVHASLQQ